MHNVTWENDRLEETDKTVIQECKTVDACKMETETVTEKNMVNKQVCNETRTEPKEKCTIEYEKGPDRVKY